MNEILVEDFRKDKNKITLIIKNLEAKIFTILKCFKNMEEINILEAKKINLTKIQKSFFLNLSNLNFLDVRENKLEKIPKNIVLLKNLKTLKLDNNLISSVPSFINELEKLEVLTLNNNKIKYFPSQFKCLQNLKELKIANNLIENIPIEFGLLKSIEILHIEGNYFTKIPTTLCYLKHLSEFSFEWLEFLDPPFQKIIKDNLGKTIITLIRNSLQELIKKNILHCSFLDFIEKNSNNENNISSRNLSEIGNNNFNSIYGSTILNNVETKKEKYCDKENLDFNNLKKEDLKYNKELSIKNEKDNNNIKITDTNLNINCLDENDNKSLEEAENNIFDDLDNHNELRIMKKVSSIKEKFSGKNTLSENKILNFINHQNQKIFYAIDNNYYGVIKALESNYDEIIKIKNIDNKTPLYYCIHINKIDIANLFISKIDFTKIPNSHIYLHKAIRNRDSTLVSRLLDIGISTIEPDDQGSTVYHILFSAFNKQTGKCALIGEMLLERNGKLNTFNNDGWAPIHIASRRGSLECINWILTKNQILMSERKEFFDINMKGKNQWTPLHLSANSYKYEISIMLIKSGADILSKNSENKTPRKVTNGNCILSKLFRNFEEEIFRENFFKKKYLGDSENIKTNYSTNLNRNLQNNDAYDTLPNENQFDDYSTLKIKNYNTDNQISNRFLETIQTNEEGEEQDDEAKIKVNKQINENEISFTENISKENQVIQLNFQEEDHKTLEIKNNFIKFDLKKFEKINKGKEEKSPKNNLNKEANYSNYNKRLFGDFEIYNQDKNELKEIKNSINLSIRIENMENLEEYGAEDKINIITEKSPAKNINDIKSINNSSNKIFFESEENLINTKNFINEFRYDAQKDITNINLMKINNKLNKLPDYEECDFAKSMSPILGNTGNKINNFNRKMFARVSNKIDNKESLGKMISDSSKINLYESLSVENQKKENKGRDFESNNNSIIINPSHSNYRNWSSNYFTNQSIIIKKKINSKFETQFQNQTGSNNNENTISDRSKNSKITYFNQNYKTTANFRNQFLADKNEPYIESSKKINYNMNIKNLNSNANPLNNTTNNTLTGVNNSMSNFNVTSNYENNKTLKFTGNYNISNSNKIKYSFLQTKTNLYYHKEIILDIDNSLSEKMESLMYLKLYATTFKNNEVQNILKMILENIDFEEDTNLNIITDVCYLIFSSGFIELIPQLEITEKKLFFQKSLLGKIAEKEVGNIIKTFKSVQDCLKKTIILDNALLQNTNLESPQYIMNENSLINLNSNFYNYDYTNTLNTHSSRDEEKFIFSNRTDEGKLNINTPNMIIPCSKTYAHHIKINKNIDIKDNILPHIIEDIKISQFSNVDIKALKKDIIDLNNDEFINLENAAINSVKNQVKINSQNNILKSGDQTIKYENIPSTNRSDYKMKNIYTTDFIKENKFKAEKFINYNINNNNEMKINFLEIQNNLNLKNEKPNSSNNKKVSNKNIKFNKKKSETSNEHNPEDILDSLNSNFSNSNSPKENSLSRRNSNETNPILSKIDPQEYINSNANRIDFSKNIINKENLNIIELYNKDMKNKIKSIKTSNSNKPRIPSEPKKTISRVNFYEKNSNTTIKKKGDSLSKPQIDIKKKILNKFELLNNKKSSESIKQIINQDSNNDDLHIKVKNNENRSENQILQYKNKNVVDQLGYKGVIHRDYSLLSNESDLYKNNTKNKSNRIYLNNHENSIGRNSNHFENLNSENSQENAIRELNEHEYNFNNIKNLNNINNLQKKSDSATNININYNVNYNINYNFNNNNPNLSYSDVDRTIFPSSTKNENNNLYNYYNTKRLKNKIKKENINNDKKNISKNKNSVYRLNSNLDSLYLSNLNNFEYENFLNNIFSEANSKKRPKNIYFKSGSVNEKPVLIKEPQISNCNNICLTESNKINIPSKNSINNNDI